MTNFEDVEELKLENQRLENELLEKQIETQKKKSSGAGALALSLCSFLGVVIPVLGVIFAICGLCLGLSKKGNLATAAILLSLLGGVLSLVIWYNNVMAWNSFLLSYKIQHPYLYY